MSKSNPSYEISSGNVFADIGIKDPADALAKAELARKIASIIKHRHLIQADAAQLLGIDQPNISRLLRGQLKDYSMERLLHFLLRLDRDIEIVILKRPRSRQQSRIDVCTV